MKKAKEIIGFPLISIHEAMELGEIKELLIDPNEGRVKYVMIMDKEWYLGAKILPFNSILSIGNDAVTIESRRDMQQFSQVEEAASIVQNDIKMIKAKVFTQKGKYIGSVIEYYIDEEDGSICGFILDGSQGSMDIKNPNIITFGSETLVIEDSVEDTMGEDIPKVGIPKLDVMSNHSNHKDIHESKAKPKSSGRLFEEKQRQFLIGRKAQRKVLDEQGDLLLEEGQLITREVLDRVTDNNKIIELTINTK
ncbi:MAG TPA: PRC-barrel domain-containing protein [Clostridia bacterium]|nr:PRC-barrel domain-containing protein [Clostridia bacterium]